MLEYLKAQTIRLKVKYLFPLTYKNHNVDKAIFKVVSQANALTDNV